MLLPRPEKASRDIQYRKVPIFGMLTQGVRGIGERHHARCHCQALRVSTPVTRSRRVPGLANVAYRAPSNRLTRGEASQPRSVATTPWLPSVASIDGVPTHAPPAQWRDQEIRATKSGFLALLTALAHLDAEYTARAHLQPPLAAPGRQRSALVQLPGQAVGYFILRQSSEIASAQLSLEYRHRRPPEAFLAEETTVAWGSFAPTSVPHA